MSQQYCKFPFLEGLNKQIKQNQTIYGLQETNVKYNDMGTSKRLENDIACKQIKLNIRQVHFKVKKIIKNKEEN